MSQPTTAFYQRLNDKLVAYRISFNQYLVMRLCLDAEETIGMNVHQTELAANLKVEPATMTGLVDKLEKLLLVNRSSVLGDRRKVAIVLTERGVRVLKSIAIHLQDGGEGGGDE